MPPVKLNDESCFTDKAQSYVPVIKVIVHKTHIQEWQPDAIAVGIPLNMDGSESKMSPRARKFGKRIHGRFNLPFYEADERLTSFEAKNWAGKLGH
ncbi:Holliday junction resolvase RuvX [Endozoicomonas sp.]|uniref:Holliday junction resolvase RuvX n=1 Tax=Endozoicomonas sp. TaxID=1892382 RepID=UPI0028837E99|nr:Holliday junction resolvase RuvX [Endozoicomonas sp.]